MSHFYVKCTLDPSRQLGFERFCKQRESYQCEWLTRNELKDYSIFGVYERYDSEMDRMIKITGLTGLKTRTVNINPDKITGDVYSLTDEQIQTMSKYNQEEVEY